MPSKKKIILFFIILAAVVGTFIFLQVFKNPTNIDDRRPPQQIKIGSKEMVKYPQDFTIVMVGDSMTERLGNSDELRVDLNKYYPNKSFQVLNYGFGSTNILSVQDRLEKKTVSTREFMPILDIAFDLVLIESFGNNPLSQFSLPEGLQKQNEALDKIVATIKKAEPQAKIAFVATIAPNKWLYGDGSANLSPKQKVSWVAERVAYIKNHMDYARSHGIPLIDVFDKSLDSDGNGKEMYLAREDHIHPSPSGVYLISEEIAKTVFEQKLL